MELIDNDELEPRIVIKTKEGWKYTVTVDGIIEGEIPPIDLEKADIKLEIEPTGWTNEDVEVVSIKVQNEEYKENKIQYSYDLKAWRDYKDTEKIKITENKKIYARLANGLSISDKYATGNITNIDKKEAEISTTMNSSNVTTKGFTVNVGVKDENSGLGKIVWHHKAECGRHPADSTGKGADAGTVNLHKILFGFLNPKRLDRVAFPPEIM